MQERNFYIISKDDPAPRTPLHSLAAAFPEDPAPEKNSDPSGGSQPTVPESFPMSGSLLEISRSEDGADFEWRLSESDIEILERGYDLLSPPLSFAGWGLWLLFGRNETDLGPVNRIFFQNKIDFDSKPLILSLCHYLEQSSPSPLVRYWLGYVKVDGGRKEVEIGRGRWKRYSLYNVYHPWLPLIELRRQMGCSEPSSGTLSVIVRLRTGPETDVEMKSLLEREEPTSSEQAAAEMFTQTDIEDDEMRSMVEREEPTSSLEGTAEKDTQTDVGDDEMRSLVEPEEPTSSLECTAEKDTQTGVEAFQRNVFQTLEQLSEEVKKIKIFLQSSTKEPMPNVRAGYPSFPITTEEDLKKFEEYLKIKEQFYSVCTYLSTTGGLSVKDCTRRILQKVISNNLSLSYNWKGIRGSKKAFSSLESVNALILGVRISRASFAILMDLKQHVKKNHALIQY